MDQSNSESDISLSPSQILERLQVLRQLQLLQRGKLQKQRLEYQETPENSSSATEIVSHFSNSTSYNTFRSLLQSSHDSSNDASPRLNISNLSKKMKELDLIEGVSVLNLSQESEFIVNTPVSSRGRISATSQNSELCSPSNKNCAALQNKSCALLKKQIALDDMPILTPKKDFEALVLEKLLVEKKLPSKSSEHNTIPKSQPKRSFLKRGEGMSRFGLRKRDLVIQSTKALPWRKQSEAIGNNKPPVSNKTKKLPRKEDNMVRVEISVAQSPKQAPKVTSIAEIPVTVTDTETTNAAPLNKKPSNCDSTHRFVQEPEHSPAPQIPRLELTKAQTKHPLQSNKGKTWASVLTTEQNDFLRQLKQSEYYKNFVSPTKSTVSDASCDETLTNLRHEREIAEQNMFELLENKVSNESFNLENSFFNRFLRQKKLECSGESTPLVLQQCLAKNPDLMHLYPDIAHKRRNDNSQSDAETCNSECMDCCSETCSSVSSCCSCKTMEETNNTVYSEKQINQANKGKLKNKVKETQKKEVDKESNKEVTNDTSNQNDNLQVNMVEMNAKLIATSDLLKDRLRELEDEIETFRQENANLTKMREEIDGERQKFYEEKASFEQKFNEEKILSEYYLAEEKEKLTKQKQMYDKYVREIRGRLNKKDKDEVLNLRKEVNDLKEEIRLKDAKSTSTIARLRNQLKLMEKEKKDFQDQIEKLKKENRRIQHSNDMTRRMTNIKYLEQINKKLSNMTTKDTWSEVNLDSNSKYKTFEIERQSRSQRVQHNTNENPLKRTRAKSVPNLKVTSRYAKYFSQRDVVSDYDRNITIDVEPLGSGLSDDNDDDDDCIENEIIQINNGVDSMQSKDNSEHEDNNLEKLYMDRFHSISPRSLSSNPSSNYNNNSHSNNPDTFFISKSNATLNRISTSPSNTSSFNNSNNSNRSKSPTLIRSQRSSDQRSPRSFLEDVNPVREPSGRSVTNISRGSGNRQSKSPISILTNRSSSIQNPNTVIHNLQYRDNLSVTPDTAVSKTSLTKTNLNPTEIRKPDGSRELRFPNGNVKFLSADGKYSRFIYYNGDIKENFLNEGRIKYYYAETKTYHTTHADGLEVLEFPDGQVEKRYKDGSSETRLPNGSVRYFDPKNEHVREEWRFPDGAALTVSAEGDQRIVFSNGQVEVHAKDHKRREFPDGTVKLVYSDGTAETRYASGRVRIKDKHGNLIMDSATG